MEKKFIAFLVAATAAAATAAAACWIRRKRTPPAVSTLSPEQIEVVSSLKRRSSNINIPCRSVRLPNYNQDNCSSYSNISVTTSGSGYLACYPRAWILDIYRRNNILPSPCDSEGFVEVPQITQSTSLPTLPFVKPDSEETCDEYMFPIEDLGGKSWDYYEEVTDSKGFVEVPQVTQSTSLPPLAFVKPDSEETEVSESIWKGKVKSSEDCDSHTESMGTVSACKIEPNFDVRECEDMTDTKSVDLSLFYKDPQGQIQGPFLLVGILSWYDQGYFGSDLPVRLLDAPEGTEFQSLGELMSNLSLRSQVTCLVNRVEQTEHSDDTRGNLEANASIPFTLNGEVLHPSGRDDLFDQTQQRLQHEVSSQMPQFSQPEIFGGVADAQRHEFSVQDAEEVLYMGRTVNKREPEEQTVDLRLLYQDPQGQIQGPFLVVHILSWYDQGFFGSDLPVRLSDAPEGTEFQSLGELMSNLSLRCQVSCLVNRVEQTEHSDDTRGNLEANASIPFTLNGEVLHPSIRDDPSNQTQQRLQHEVSSQMPQFSQPEIFGGVADARRHEFSVQDAEGVLYMGRTVNSTQTSGRLASDIHDLPQTSNNNQGLQTGHPNFMNYKVLTDDDSNPLGLSWSELEGTHHKGPLSSITAWSSNGRGNASSNILHDAFDGSLSHFEPDINNLTIEDHFLSQNFQKQHLKRQHLMPSHQNQQLNASYLEHLHGPSYQQQSIRREHMLKLQVERQQCLQQLEQEEQLHQQHQLHRRMQLLQQQHRQQQHQQRQQHQLHQQRQQLQVERQQRLQQLEQEEQLHQQHQLHRRMQLLQRQHMQHQQQHQQRQQHQLHQQRQQHQLLLEQLLHHKLQDANYGVPRVDPLLGENSIDQILYRQQLLHEPSLDQLIQAKFVHNLQHQNELLETLNHPSNRYMLTFEQQYLLDLQQARIQSRRFPIASRQQPVMDEERHVGGAWYESGQFISAPVGHHTRSDRPSQLDFVQPLQRNSSFEQPAHVDCNFLQHDRIQKGNFGLNSQSFERSAGTPMPDMDMNTFARLQGMDLQERYGRTNSPGQMGQLSGNCPQQNWMSNQIHAPHLDAMERNWSEASRQLQNNLTDSQFARLHLAMEKQNREVRPYLSFEDWNQQQSLDGNNEILNHGPAEVLQQKLRLQSSQQLGFAHSKGVDMSTERVDISDLKDGVRVKQHGSKIIALNKSGLDALEGGRIDQTEDVDHGALKNKLPVRDASFGVARGGTNLYNYNMGPDCAYVDLMANDRMSGIFVSNSDGSLVRRPHPLSSQGVSSELVKGLNSDSFAYSHEMRHEGGGHSESSWTSSCSDTTTSCSDTDAASEASCSDTTSSCSDTDTASEASFKNMLKQIPEDIFYLSL